MNASRIADRELAEWYRSMIRKEREAAESDRCQYQQIIGAIETEIINRWLVTTEDLKMSREEFEEAVRSIWRAEPLPKEKK